MNTKGQSPSENQTPTRATNPTGRRTAALAATLPPGPVFHFLPPGVRPSGDQWRAMMDFFKANPDMRIRRGQQWAADVNRYFIQYSRHYEQGERWGTKEQLSKARASANRAARQSQRRRFREDPEFRARQVEKLAQLVQRRAAIEQGEAEAKKDAAKRQKAIRRREEARLEDLALLARYGPRRKPPSETKAEKRQRLAAEWADRNPEKDAELRARGVI